jgi:hypothetical protein
VYVQQEEQWKTYQCGLNFVSMAYWQERFSWYLRELWVGCRDSEQRENFSKASMPGLKGEEQMHY